MLLIYVMLLQKSLDKKFSIKLRAANAHGDDSAGLTLRISLPSTYPKSLPHLILDFGPDIRHASRSQAELMLVSKPKSLLGSEMIFEIATVLQEILDNTWIDPGQTLALDAERNAKDAAIAIADEQHKKEEELQARLAEERLLQELADQRENRTNIKRARVAKVPETYPNGDDSLQMHTEVVRFERSAIVQLSDGQELVIPAVWSKLPYSQGLLDEIYRVQSINRNPDAGTTPGWPHLLLKECYIPSNKSNEVQVKRSLQSLESKLEKHLDLSPHPNILKPLNYRIHRSLEANSAAQHGWTVSILMELADRRSLRETLDVVDKVDVSLIRAWSIQLLEGLQHYHRHGFVHADVQINNILLQRDREAERGNRKITTAKLSDGGYQRDLHILRTEAGPSPYPAPWTAPEIVNAATTAFGPATDIWNLGCCFLQMAFGVGVLHEFQSPTTLMEGLELTSSVRSLLSQIFQHEPRKRPSAWDLLHFEFFRLDSGILVGEDVTSSVASMSGLLTSHPSRTRRESGHGPAALAASRYTREFTEDGRLGRGGFGEVFRVRNKVDGQPYAVKKVKARSKAALDPVLSEVSVLSRLNHPHIVRYFAAWIEDGVSNDGTSETTDDYTPSVPEKSSLFPSSQGLDFISSNNAQVVFANDDSESDSSTDGGEEDDSTCDAVSGTETREDEEMPTPHEQSDWTVLYIQMEYCKQETLRDLINSGLQANEAEIWRLFRQILQGLAHMHSLSIVHRDLKPENIFIDGKSLQRRSSYPNLDASVDLQGRGALSPVSSLWVCRI